MWPPAVAEGLQHRLSLGNAAMIGAIELSCNSGLSKHQSFPCRTVRETNRSHSCCTMARRKLGVA